MHIVEKRIRELIEAEAPETQDLLTQLFTGEAKMLRPHLVQLAAGNPEEISQELLDLMAAIELTHVSSLYHDDIIDEDELRRGVQSAHAKFGIGNALLGGDFLFALALKLGEGISFDAMKILGTAFRKMCAGQIMEQNEQIDSRESYFKMIDLKTSSLFIAACELGLQIDSNDASPIREFAKNYGRYFQIQDDFSDNADFLVELGITETDSDGYRKKCFESIKAIYQTTVAEGLTELIR